MSVNKRGRKVKTFQECDICSQKFNNKRDLRRHIDGVHKGKRDKICNSCGKSFAFDGNLYVHIKRVHEKVARKYVIYQIQNSSSTFQMPIKMNPSLGLEL